MASDAKIFDFELLHDLERQGGRAKISDGRPRHGAERLVELGYATSRALSMSDVEYEIAQRGRTALALGDSLGLSDNVVRYEPAGLTIEPRCLESEGGVYRIGVSSPGNPALFVDIGGAVKLVERLRSIGAVELADRFEVQIDRAKRYAVAG